MNGMTEIQNNNFHVDEMQDQKAGSYRKILFLIYVLTAWVVVAVLAVAVFQAEGWSLLVYEITLVMTVIVLFLRLVSIVVN